MTTRMLSKPKHLGGSLMGCAVVGLGTSATAIGAQGRLRVASIRGRSDRRLAGAHGQRIDIAKPQPNHPWFPASMTKAGDGGGPMD